MLGLVLCVALVGGLSVEWTGPPRLGVCIKAPVALPNGDLLAWRNAPLQPQGTAVHCFRSTDDGKTWHYLSDIATTPDPGADVGDGAFLALPDGRVLHSYRDNRTRGPEDERSFAIRVAVSGDGGTTWRPHSTVAEASGAKYGLWSSYLLRRSDGVLQCYYDDEVTPAAEDLRMHQWLSMKTWDAETGAWVERVTVSRAHNPDHLSRDGMCTVHELESGRLLCVFESVQTEPRFAGVLRQVSSDDGGATWSWRDKERAVVYEPPDRRYNALAPWTVTLDGDTVLCVFTTDTDRKDFGVASTGVLDQDLRYTVTHDGGATWSPPEVIDADHPIYFPGVTLLRRDGGPDRLLVQYLHKHRGFFIREGVVAERGKANP